ncbi:osmotically-inducible protein OsmY [Oxalobacteraceae bacterium GrIS 2.11]
MKTDPQLQQDVIAELESDPLFSGTDIEVSVEDGIVTLRGAGSSIAVKAAAENLAKNIVGVKAVIEKIQVTEDSELIDSEDISNLSRSSPINF